MAAFSFHQLLVGLAIFSLDDGRALFIVRVSRSLLPEASTDIPMGNSREEVTVHHKYCLVYREYKDEARVRLD